MPDPAGGRRAGPPRGYRINHLPGLKFRVVGQKCLVGRAAEGDAPRWPVFAGHRVDVVVRHSSRPVIINRPRPVEVTPPSDSSGGDTALRQVGR